MGDARYIPTMHGSVGKPLTIRVDLSQHQYVAVILTFKHAAKITLIVGEPDDVVLSVDELLSFDRFEHGHRPVRILRHHRIAVDAHAKVAEIRRDSYCAGFDSKPLAAHA